jgi:hypothetical protein
MVYIIAGQRYTAQLIECLNHLFMTNWQDKYINEEARYRQWTEDLVSLRLAILLFKALRNEKIREVYICTNGFEIIQERYPFYCKNRTTTFYK